MTNDVKPFPFIDLIPKKETQAWQFLQKHPTYDGRNVIIGILDTGIDPGAFGLYNNFTRDDNGNMQVSPKLIDMIDCTGAGDVDVSTRAALDEVTVDGESHWQVKGLTGRMLKLSKKLNIQPFSMVKEHQAKAATRDKGSEASEKSVYGVDSSGDNNSTDDADTKTKERTTKNYVRLGIKAAYELFPGKLKARLKEERAKDFRQAVGTYEQGVRAQLATWKGDLAGEKPTPAQAKVRDNLQALLDVLNDKEWQEDPGPLYDCVVYFDGTHYRAIVDGRETGDLRQVTKGMAAFGVEREFGTFGVLDQMNFGVQFYEDGTILSLVSDASPHGTHVAGIASMNANTADSTTDDKDAIAERCGVAPGAQLVSLKIGDSRLGSMETGTSLTRALIEAIRHKCDVINLSYGEGCVWPNSGRFIELANDFVWKHNIVFVSSAGNNGPAVSTVGAPGGTSSACIGVAAYVSPAMMHANYSMPLPQRDANAPTSDEHEDHAGSTFTWSSVGPTADGDHGVNISAPGCAITSVSNWCLQKSMLMNGTSMSSPNATGCVALLISACKQEGISVSPARIRRALENTAQAVPALSTLQQGWGMVQVESAFEYLKATRGDIREDVYFDVTIDSLPGNPRGIYLRQLEESSLRQTFSVSVDPKQRPEDQISIDEQRKRIDLEMHFTLEATEQWVSAPGHFMLTTNGRSFKIDVDPSGLRPGVHTARVHGVDVNNAATKRTIFSVPITVVKPLGVQRDLNLGKITFRPAESKRFFVVPPLGSTWMDVILRDCRDGEDKPEGSTKMVVLHKVQFLPHAAYRDFETQKYYNLRPGQTCVTSIAVEEGATCEITLARYWSTIGSTVIDAEVHFRGVRPAPNCVVMKSGCSSSLVRLYSDLRDETVAPTVKLSSWLTPIRPKPDPKIAPLGSRDVLPARNKPIYQLLLAYEFNQEEKGSVKLRCPALQGVLYESSFESQLMLVFDDDKKYLGVADAWPDSVKVPKGKITIRLQIRHDDTSKLEKLKDVMVWVERSIESGIALTVYGTKKDLMLDETPFKKRVLRKGCSVAVLIAEPPAAKLPSGCKTGDVVTGSVTYSCGDTNLAGSGKRPGGFPITYLVGPKAEKASTDADTPEPKDERSTEEKLNEAVRDLKVERMGKLSPKEKDAGQFETLYKKLELEYPDHLPLLMCNLKYLDMHKERAKKLSDIVAAADKVIGKIDEAELALHFGKKSDTEDPEAVKLRKDMKERKTHLTEALARKAMAYHDKENATEGVNNSSNESFDLTLKKLKEWVDIDGTDKYAPLVFGREIRAGRNGFALKLVNKLLSKDLKDKESTMIQPLTKADLYAKRSKILYELGYFALVDYDTKNSVLACPKSFALF